MPADLDPASEPPLGALPQRHALERAQPAPMALLDAGGCIVALNESWRIANVPGALFGGDFRLGEDYCQACADARGNGAEDAESVAAGVRLVLQADASEFLLEYPCQAAEATRWYQLVVTPLAGPGKAGVVVMHIEVTAERRDAEHLRQREQKYNATFLHNPQPMWIFDLKTLRFLAVNLAVARMMETDNPEAVRNEPLSRWIHPEDIEAYQALHERASADGVETHQFRVRGPKGGTRWMEADSTVLPASNGSVRAVLGTARDITQQRTTEEQLRQSQGLLQMASTLSRLGAWSVELPGCQMRWSPEVAEILELPHDYEPTVEASLEFYAPEHQDRIREAFNRCMEQGVPWDLELELFTAKKRRLWVRSMGEAVRDDHGKLVRVQGAFQDISERRKAELREKVMEDRLVRTLDAIPDAFVTLDGEWRYTFFNGQAERMTGRPRNEILGTVIWDVFPALVGSTIETEFRRAAAEYQALEFEAYYEPLALWLGVRVFPTEEGVAAYFSDVTEKRQAHEALADSEQRFRELAEHVRDVFYNHDPVHGEVRYISPAYESIWGRTCASLYAHPRSFVRAIVAADRPLAIAAYRQQRKGMPTDLEYRIRRPDGEIRWIHDMAFPVLNAAGEVDRVVGTARDITPRKVAEIYTKVSEERFRLLSKATNDAIWDWDLDTQTLWWNEGFELLFGFSREEVSPTIESWTAHIHPEDKAGILKVVQDAIHSGAQAWSGEYRFCRKDGSYAYVLDRGHVIHDDTGKAIRMIGGMTDLSERKETEIYLAQQAALIDEASDVIMVRDLDNRVLFCNRATEQIYGWKADEIVGKFVGDIFYKDPGPLAAATAAVLEQGKWAGELHQVRRDGSPVIVLGRWTLLRDEQGAPSKILSINTDITERKRLEQQFLRAQRMESIGTLAGGIAHDLNNVLAPIMMSTEMLADFVKHEEGRAILDSVRNSAQRGADLVRQVLGFARGTEGERRVVRLAKIAGEVEKVALDTFPRSISFELDARDDVWPVLGDSTQLHQILMNLCVNARDAMPEGGTLTLAFNNLVVDEVFAGMNVHAKPGPYVIIRVEDTGIGMPKEVQEKIFEPFFTTKELEQGTGLGLSTTFSIVRDHGGFINLYSEPGRGTKFKIYLPATPGEEESEETARAQSKLPCGNGELVLLVDDEASIRDITTRALERYGYRVMTAVHGAEAVALYVQHREEIAVILTDMSMPIMDGPAMIAALKSIDPEVRIIASSGLDANGKVAKALGAGIQHFVPKPYTADALLNILQQVLAPEKPKKPAARKRSKPSQSVASAPPAPVKVKTKKQTLPPGTSPKVLVVEENELLLGLTKRILERMEFDVHTAAHALEALEAFEAHPSIALLILDLRIPGKESMEVLDKIRAQNPAVRVILTSADPSLSDELKTRLGPETRVLHKPYAARELAAAVQDALAS